MRTTYEIANGGCKTAIIQLCPHRYVDWDVRLLINGKEILSGNSNFESFNLVFKNLGTNVSNLCKTGCSASSLSMPLFLLPEADFTL